MMIEASSHPWCSCHWHRRDPGHGPLESVPEAFVRHSIAQLLPARTLALPHAGGHFQACEHHRRAAEALRVPGWLGCPLHHWCRIRARVRRSHIGDCLARPTLLPALLFGVGTVMFPVLRHAASFGLGIAASRTPKPMQARLKSLATHTVFGVGLYVCALAVSNVLRPRLTTACSRRRRVTPEELSQGNPAERPGPSSICRTPRVCPGRQDARTGRREGGGHGASHRHASSLDAPGGRDSPLPLPGSLCPRCLRRRQDVRQALPDFLIHLTPMLLLLVVVAVSWRWEWVGAVASSSDSLSRMCTWRGATRHGFWAYRFPFCWLACCSF